jgi:hypothetical protein
MQRKAINRERYELCKHAKEFIPHLPDYSHACYLKVNPKNRDFDDSLNKVKLRSPDDCLECQHFQDKTVRHPVDKPRSIHRTVSKPLESHKYNPGNISEPEILNSEVGRVPRKKWSREI